jgi:hypothetical protein
MSIAPTFNDAEPAPIEMDPRPCELCGCTIDRHHRVDTEEGPEFFCISWHPDELTLPELERRAELRLQEEAAAILARWEAMDDPSKRLPPRAGPEPYRTPQSTIDAFWYVVRLADPQRLAAWLDDHPKGEFFLLNLLESK